jgi:hypothetical protein
LLTTPQTRSLPSNLTLNQFAEAMKALNLAEIPPQNRNAALMAHLARIMAASIHDRARAQDLVSAILVRARARHA